MRCPSFKSVNALNSNIVISLLSRIKKSIISENYNIFHARAAEQTSILIVAVCAIYVLLAVFNVFINE